MGAATHDLRAVQESMGHRSADTTQIYTQVSDGQVLELVDALDW